MAPAQLDHIILLLPNLSSIPKALTELFTILPGGKHADGLTENLLIPLSTGEYIELVAFQDGVSHQDRKKHWWGTKTEGAVIDWCLAGSPPLELMGKSYAEPQKGGRINKLESGELKALKWEVTFPNKERYGQGEIPFWCKDVTARDWRVPKATVHPSGILGVAQVIVAISSSSEVVKMGELLEKVFVTTSSRHSSLQSNTGTQETCLVEMGPTILEPPQLKGRGLQSHVSVILARDEWEQTVVSKNGSAAVVELVFWVDRESELPPVETKVGEGRLKFSFIKI
jgi:hypothetical protein